MTDPFLEALRHEISETQHRREKLAILKIAFVTALLGFGAVRIKDVLAVYQVLYMAPLAASFFDLLIQGEHFSIRRMGAFLRLHSHINLEREYQRFVRDNRDKFFKFGSFGFTALSYVAAIALLKSSKGHISWLDVSWFSAMFFVSFTTVIHGNHVLKKLDAFERLQGTNPIERE